MKCFNCGEELNKAEIDYNTKHAEYCCDGSNCACMGMPISPPYCFKCISNGLTKWEESLSKRENAINKLIQ